MKLRYNEHEASTDSSVTYLFRTLPVWGEVCKSSIVEFSAFRVSVGYAQSVKKLRCHSNGMMLSALSDSHEK
jgi:hypothetical protein